MDILTFLLKMCERVNKVYKVKQIAFGLFILFYLVCDNYVYCSKSPIRVTIFDNF